MKLIEVKERDGRLTEVLSDIWKRSVRETHLFLSEQDIRDIGEYVPAAFREVPHLVTAVDSGDRTVGFMGIGEGKLEMLFLDPKERGKGIGTLLLQYGFRNYDVREVCVNEQNPQAKGFYEHAGFRVYKRTDLDEQGNAWPLLYMRME